MEKWLSTSTCIPIIALFYFKKYMEIEKPHEIGQEDKISSLILE